MTANQSTKPRRAANGRFVKRSASRASVPAVQPLQPLQAPLTLRSAWKAHVVIICIAIAWVYCAPLVVLVGIIAAPFVLTWMLERTGHYRAAHIVAVLTVAAFSGFMSGLFGRRGYYGSYYGRWHRW